MLHNRKVQKLTGKQDRSDRNVRRDPKRWKGFIVVEASYLMPFTLVLYGIIILIAAVLLVRCLSSQNRFLQAWQGERHTNSDTSEVIYADMESS